MVIESIKPYKDKCIIVIDGSEQTLAYEVVLRHKLSAKSNVSPVDFRTMLDESEELICKDYLYKMIGKYLKSEKGYRDKLYQVGYHKKAVDKAIENCKNYGYIDDEKYCENYISVYKNKKGVNKLRQELKNKGISTLIINKFLDSYQSKDDVIDNLCAKFMKNKENNLESKQKLYRHLLSKGFGYDEVSKAVDKWYKDAE